MLRFYNTLGRKKQDFVPVEKGKVGIYSCGPTVYNYVHIGNLRAYVFVDILKRYLLYRGYAVKHAMNLTDVDDKTIAGSRKEGKSLKEFTDFYSEAFFEDIKSLGIIMPDIVIRATDEIDEMAKLVSTLLEKGFAYRSDDGIYFRISKFPEYGQIACLDIENLKAGASGRTDADDYDKEDAHDFALWKFWTEDDGDVFWETELGKGRPGWHIECSAMASKYLGQPFDIHTGGVDLIFPHHTNEIAQSEAASGKKLANFWMHNEHLIVNSQKMSKSIGNFYTLRDLIAKGYSPRQIRYEMLSTHYRQKLDFREDSLKSLSSVLQKFDDFTAKLDEACGIGSGSVSQAVAEARHKFEESLDDDLNISGALASVFEMMNSANKVMDSISKSEAEELKKALIDFDSVLGVIFPASEDIPEDIKELAEERIRARSAKDWEKSDSLRDEIKSRGYSVEDTKSGYRLRKNN